MIDNDRALHGDGEILVVGQEVGYVLWAHVESRKASCSEHMQPLLQAFAGCLILCRL